MSETRSFDYRPRAAIGLGAATLGAIFTLSWWQGAQRVMAGLPSNLRGVPIDPRPEPEALWYILLGVAIGSVFTAFGMVATALSIWPARRVELTATALLAPTNVLSRRVTIPYDTIVRVERRETQVTLLVVHHSGGELFIPSPMLRRGKLDELEAALRTRLGNMTPA